MAEYILMFHDTPENTLKSYDHFSSPKHKNTTVVGKKWGKREPRNKGAKG